MSPNLPGPIPDSTRPLDVTMPADVTNLMTSQQNATGGAATKVVGTPDPALTGTLTGLLPADGVIATYTQTREKQRAPTRSLPLWLRRRR